MSQQYILRNNYYAGMDFKVYYSADDTLFNTWTIEVKYATPLNVFKAKRAVQRYKLKDYDLIEIKE